VPYYVPVGSRGVILRFGTLLTSVLGSVTYWRASRRRAAIPANPSFVLNVPDA
jgi:hypothetical protein